VDCEQLNGRIASAISRAADHAWTTCTFQRKGAEVDCSRIQKKDDRPSVLLFFSVLSVLINDDDDDDADDNTDNIVFRYCSIPLLSEVI